MSEAWAVFGAVAAAHALGVSSPGPDFAMVLRQTLAHGRQVGIATALGIGSGICAHVALGLFGLGWIVDRVPGVLDALRIGGAAVLLWIGLRALRARPLPVEESTPSLAPAIRSGQAYLIGLATNLLNAKALLVFLALGSGVIAAGASPALRLALGTWMVLATAAYFSFIAWTVGLPGVRRRLRAHAHRIDRAMGALLVGLAIAVAVGGSTK